jgi:hypothetical protein
VLNPKVAVPVAIDDAIRAEAERTGLRRHQVLEDWFVQTWPDYVARNLRRDLGRTAAVIDVAVSRYNGAPGLLPRGARDDLDSTPVVELNSTARRLNESASGGEAP